tara:strand:+ start:220 stop:657 length:438 start_codon:yes stop_codon:yes gene_type:complete
MKVLLSIVGFFAFWLKPDLRYVFKVIAIGVGTVAFILYLHNEYINWSELTTNTKYLSWSFVVKNVLIFITTLTIIFLIKKKKDNKKYDGFDQFREETYHAPKETKFVAAENKTSTEIDDSYFDQFRDKKKLRTTSEVKLGKKTSK